MLKIIKQSYEKHGLWRGMKSAAKFTVDPNRQFLPQYYPPDWVRVRIMRIIPWLLGFKNQNKYNMLSEVELLQTKISDNLFIFGSGYSINQITDIEIKHFESNQTLSFNWFPHQKFINIDYHLIREIASSDYIGNKWKSQINEYANLISNNPFYSNAIFLMQKGYPAINSNRILQYKLLPKTNPIFRWNSLRNGGRVSNSISKGLSHIHSTLFECINFGFLMGWKNIVLVGVDLYDKRYFWMPYNEIRPGMKHINSKVTDPHNTARQNMFETMKSWASHLHENGTTLYVYNPKSLLSSVLPIYPKPANTETTPSPTKPIKNKSLD